jgi:hypothetical protein
MVYNFVKPHGSLRVRPAMAADKADRLWSYEEVIGFTGGFGTDSDRDWSATA